VGHLVRRGFAAFWPHLRKALEALLEMLSYGRSQPQNICGPREAVNSRKRGLQASVIKVGRTSPYSRDHISRHLLRTPTFTFTSTLL